MRGNVRRDTRPELAVRRAVHRLGLRYRVDARPIASLNRRADLVFPRAQIAVFVDGCYWHACPDHGTLPTANGAYWSAKIEGNVTRDRETDAILRDAGWTSIRFWEHTDPLLAAAEVASRYRARLKSRQN